MEAMLAQLARANTATDDRLHLHFALGKAYEDAAQFATSFEHYERGNHLRRSQIHYSPEDNSSLFERSRALYTRGFFGARRRPDSHSPAPTFTFRPPRP